LEYTEVGELCGGMGPGGTNVAAARCRARAGRNAANARRPRTSSARAARVAALTSSNARRGLFSCAKRVFVRRSGKNGVNGRWLKDEVSKNY